MGLATSEDRLGVNRPHDAVLVEVLGLGVHVGADVDDHDRPLVRREDRGDPRASDAGQEHLGVEQPRGDHRAGVPGRDHRLDLAGGHQSPALRDRVIALLPQRLDRLLVHADDLAGMHDRQAVARRVAGLGELGLDLAAVADQHDGQVGLVAHRLDGAGDDRPGGMIAPHRVQGNPHEQVSRPEGGRSTKVLSGYQETRQPKRARSLARGSAQLNSTNVIPFNQDGNGMPESEAGGGTPLWLSASRNATKTCWPRRDRIACRSTVRARPGRRDRFAVEEAGPDRSVPRPRKVDPRASVRALTRAQYRRGRPGRLSSKWKGWIAGVDSMNRRRLKRSRLL